MSSELTNDDLDDLEVELAQVEQTLRLLDDENVDPNAAVEWLTEETVDSDVDDVDDDGPLAPVVELHNRTS